MASSAREILTGIVRCTKSEANSETEDRLFPWDIAKENSHGGAEEEQQQSAFGPRGTWLPFQSFEFWSFEFVSDFVLRISDFLSLGVETVAGPDELCYSLASNSSIDLRKTPLS